MTAPRLILGSSSPRRVELLAQIGLFPDLCIAPNIKEQILKGELPHHAVLRIARMKAEAVAAHHPLDIILAADTMVVCGRRALPKAESIEEAQHCLRILSGRRHRVYTAIAVHTPKKGIRATRVMAHVQFRRLNDKDIARYVASDEWKGKAGGYALQGMAAAFISAVHGTPSCVIGLPLCETVHMLKNAGLAW